jgi:hypothetical protein
MVCSDPTVHRARVNHRHTQGDALKSSWETIVTRRSGTSHGAASGWCWTRCARLTSWCRRRWRLFAEASTSHAGHMGRRQKPPPKGGKTKGWPQLPGRRWLTRPAVLARCRSARSQARPGG